MTSLHVSPTNSRWIHVTAEAGGTYDAYLCLPPTGSGPGLVLFGNLRRQPPHPHGGRAIRARRFVVLAPDVSGVRHRASGSATRVPTWSAPGPCGCGRSNALAADAEDHGRAARAARVKGRSAPSAIAWAAGCPSSGSHGGRGFGGVLLRRRHPRPLVAERISCPTMFHHGETDGHP
jgi:carboxymethylenebutenolidase